MTRLKQERKCWLWRGGLAKPFHPPSKVYFGRALSFLGCFLFGEGDGKDAPPQTPKYKYLTNTTEMPLGRHGISDKK